MGVEKIVGSTSESGEHDMKCGRERGRLSRMEKAVVWVREKEEVRAHGEGERGGAGEGCGRKVLCGRKMRAKDAVRAKDASARV